MVRELSDGVTETQMLQQQQKTFKEMVTGENYL